MNKGSQEDIQSAVGRTIERVARESYGRLVAYLSVHTHDLASAEDALSEALVSALKAWPRDGLPQERDLPERLDAVLEAIYAAFGISWDDMFGIDPRGRDLAEEAIWLARVL